jgi:predicted RNA binding protein YcfA (HicA-like mRNA interferase family)
LALEFPSAKSKEVCRALEAFGFVMVKAKCIHYFYRLPGEDIVHAIQVPYHSAEVSRVTVKMYAKRLRERYGVTFKEFIKALKSGKARKLTPPG